MQLRQRAVAAAAVAAAAAMAAVSPAAAVQVAPAAAKPKIVVPGDWLTDKGGKYLFLPMTIPSGISLQQCKVLCNGDHLLVVVTEQPQDEPETDALRKYKLVLDALKAEVGHDENKLKAKLTEWLETEEDQEVRVRVQAALNSLSNVREAKNTTKKRSFSIGLGLPKSFLQESQQLRGSTANSTVSHGLPASAALRTLVAQSGRGTRVRVHGAAASAASEAAGSAASHAASIIKESFTVEIPYPVPVPKVFAVLSAPEKIVVGMPWMKKTLAAKGVSTGGRPFARVPVFDAKGKLLVGPNTASLSQLTSDFNVSFVANLQPASV